VKVEILPPPPAVAKDCMICRFLNILLSTSCLLENERLPTEEMKYQEFRALECDKTKINHYFEGRNLFLCCGPFQSKINLKYA
jgi:hypothetical protein